MTPDLITAALANPATWQHADPAYAGDPCDTYREPMVYANAPDLWCGIAITIRPHGLAYDLEATYTAPRPGRPLYRFAATFTEYQTTRDFAETWLANIHASLSEEVTL